MTSRDKKLLPVAIGVIAIAIVLYFVLSPGAGTTGQGAGAPPAPAADTPKTTDAGQPSNRVAAPGGGK